MKPATALLLLAFGLSSQMAEAVAVTSKDELKLLPAICKGTQAIRNVSGDKTPISEYKKMYGADFQHLHHYCWALNTENKYYRDPSSYHSKNMLGTAIGDLDYVIKNSRPTFVFLPDVYLAKARILALQKQNSQAAAAALQAINSKPELIPAYSFLSDLYVTLGDKKSAIKTLQSGLEHTPDSKPLLRRLTTLGGTPPARTARPEKGEGNLPPSVGPALEETTARSAPVSATSGDPDPATQQPVTNSEQSPGSELPQAVSPPPKNPYCRFCP